MKITKISIVIAIIIGIVVLFAIPSVKQSLYFLPLVIIVSVIRSWEKATKKNNIFFLIPISRSKKSYYF
ncbi:hypothetical protein [Carnobacterium viridans]|uniref:Uncharacterized protein n=1 Tax=Carnobacterium viridans TaxID=174587 RepID=A0A1H0XID2_9LACT|nr:hypothetical protein [Carnobacterium viridans]SDQ02678.1 hypothetical protein SAMN04487752_0204 [Carnobacterium viridans]